MAGRRLVRLLVQPADGTQRPVRADGHRLPGGRAASRLTAWLGQPVAATGVVHHSGETPTRHACRPQDGWHSPQAEPSDRRHVTNQNPELDLAVAVADDVEPVVEPSIVHLVREAETVLVPRGHLLNAGQHR